MASLDWSKVIDLDRAVANLNTETVGDWHQDPWGWPEYEYMLKRSPNFVYEHCRRDFTYEPALIDVPKENWGTRPAVVLDIVDRLTYQAIVDRLSIALIGDLSPNVFGWRLPPTKPALGAYSHNNNQWEGYRNHLGTLATVSTVALRSDIVSCFANIQATALSESIFDRCPSSAPTKRLVSLIDGFSRVPDRSGIPQRSLASAVLANMFLSPLDDVLLHYSSPIPVFTGMKIKYNTFARWMDDIWLFGLDVAAARQAQVELQTAARSIGLNLNDAKTDLLEGPDVAEQALEVEHSAVDGAIESKDFEPLEALIDRILDDPARASRTSVKFATQRMREHKQYYRAQDLIQVAHNMPHATDALSRLFKVVFTHSSLQNWYLNYAQGPWATHEWAVAQLGRMFPSSKTPRRDLQDYFASAIRDANTSLPLLALSSQRMVSWNPSEARLAFRDSFRRAANPHARRVIALCAAQAGETRTKVRGWLKADEENAPTLAMLEDWGFDGPKVQHDFAE